MTQVPSPSCLPQKTSRMSLDLHQPLLRLKETKEMMGSDFFLGGGQAVELVAG